MTRRGIQDAIVSLLAARLLLGLRSLAVSAVVEQDCGDRLERRIKRRLKSRGLRRFAAGAAACTAIRDGHNTPTPDRLIW
jgi:hypothetical protein